MITHHAFGNLGGANHGWLDTRHHFSFADYYDPQKLSHGELMVINDDRIAPHTGFEPHPHRDMEIITYVRKGAITHEDNKGNKGRTSAGDVQVMSAGTGIFHSEHNLEDEETNIYQIWITPAKKGVSPRWNAAEFPKEPVTNTLQLLVSGSGDAPLKIYQNARIFAGRISEGGKIRHSILGKAYLLVAEGEVMANDLHAKKGDGIAISDEDSIFLQAKTEAELLIIEVPGVSQAR